MNFPLPQPTSTRTSRAPGIRPRHAPRKLSGSRSHTRSHRSIRGPRFGFFRILILSGSFAVVDMDYYSKPAVPRKYSAQIFSPLAKTGFVHYNILRKSGIGPGALSSAPAGPSNHRGVAQLVARLLWEQEAQGSNPCTPTKKPAEIA